MKMTDRQLAHAPAIVDGDLMDLFDRDASDAS
jgi:hypothetical protein